VVAFADVETAGNLADFYDVNITEYVMAAKGDDNFRGRQRTVRTGGRARL